MMKWVVIIDTYLPIVYPRTMIDEYERFSQDSQNSTYVMVKKLMQNIYPARQCLTSH